MERIFGKKKKFMEDLYENVFFWKWGTKRENHNILRDQVGSIILVRPTKYLANLNWTPMELDCKIAICNADRFCYLMEICFCWPNNAVRFYKPGEKLTTFLNIFSPDGFGVNGLGHYWQYYLFVAFTSLLYFCFCFSRV